MILDIKSLSLINEELTTAICFLELGTTSTKLGTLMIPSTPTIP